MFNDDEFRMYDKYSEENWEQNKHEKEREPVKVINPEKMRAMTDIANMLEKALFVDKKAKVKVNASPDEFNNGIITVEFEYMELYRSDMQTLIKAIIEEAERIVIHPSFDDVLVYMELEFQDVTTTIGHLREILEDDEYTKYLKERGEIDENGNEISDN